MIVVVCPGQGSQTPGFLEPWLTEPQFRNQLAAYSEAIGIDLIGHGTTSDAETIRDTAVAQPLIVAAGILTLRALAEARPGAISGIAGHSVGEFTAAAGAGILSDVDALRLVAARGAAMAEAAAITPTGMSAVVGGDEAELLEILDRLSLAPANFNGGGQIVVAGSLESLATLKDEAPRGARVIPLQVAGAFHTAYMETAEASLRQTAEGVTANDPTLPIWTNHDGARVESGGAFVDLLLSQVTSSVRWDKTMESLAAAGVTGIIEVAPAGALVGLAKRGLKGIPTVAIKTPADLTAALELIDGTS